jgi:trehalose 6-phosphate phosphatase
LGVWNTLKIDLDRYQATILDIDGVITRSAGVHEASWKQMFDEYLQERAGRENRKYRPFDMTDYYRYVDGKPRYEGVQSFLKSRGTRLPHGSPDDSPDQETVCGLGNRKNKLFLEYLSSHRVESYQSTLSFAEEMKRRKKLVAHSEFGS